MRFSPSICFLLWACCLVWACENPPILSPQASPPQADAGQDLRSQVREVVILDGMDSQAADNSPLGFSWAQVEGPPISIQHAGTGRAQVIPTAEGVYVFRLTVTDGMGLSQADEMVLQVTDPTGGKPSESPGLNTAPIARAGRDVQTEALVAVLLDGSASSDDQDSELVFTWVQLDGTPLLIQNAATAQAMVVPEEVGEYSFRLTVTDARGLSASDEVVMVVTLSHTDGVLQISAAPLGPEVAKVEYTIAAADIDTLAGELLITADQTAQKTLLAVPPGRDRLIELFAHNDANEVVAFGSALVQIQENETVVVAIEMLELRSPRGSIEIEAVFEGVSQEGG
jgi:hypothetical protein